MSTILLGAKQVATRPAPLQGLSGLLPESLTTKQKVALAAGALGLAAWIYAEFIRPKRKKKGPLHGLSGGRKLGWSARRYAASRRGYSSPDHDEYRSRTFGR